MNKIKIKNKVFICLAVDDELKKKLDEEADKLGLTTNGYIRLILLKRNI